MTGQLKTRAEKANKLVSKNKMFFVYICYDVVWIDVSSKLFWYPQAGKISSLSSQEIKDDVSYCP